jgi:hypothetical protein
MHRVTSPSVSRLRGGSGARAPLALRLALRLGERRQHRGGGLALPLARRRVGGGAVAPTARCTGLAAGGRGSSPTVEVCAGLALFGMHHLGLRTSQELVCRTMQDIR